MRGFALRGKFSNSRVREDSHARYVRELYVCVRVCVWRNRAVTCERAGYLHVLHSHIHMRCSKYGDPIAWNAVVKYMLCMLQGGLTMCIWLQTRLYFDYKRVCVFRVGQSMWIIIGAKQETPYMQARTRARKHARIKNMMYVHGTHQRIPFDADTGLFLIYQMPLPDRYKMDSGGNVRMYAWVWIRGTLNMHC